MACPALQTGERFLATAIGHINCQAQTIGSYGYGALASPGSATSIALTGLLTIFVALFGVRLLFGYPVAGRDVIGDVLKVAIVLTLATSWPAWRVLGYDLVIDGPEQIGRVIGLASGLPGSNGDFASRLQRVDEGLAALNAWGSGRLGVAQGDWFQLGFARTAYLTGTLGPLSLVRLTAGILLALAPLVAGLMLFGVTRAIFEGWAKGLAASFLASIALILVLGVELALLEPWLQHVLQMRAADRQALDAPVEILVVTLAFALVSFGVLALAIRIAFNPSLFVTVLSRRDDAKAVSGIAGQRSGGTDAVTDAGPSRAAVVAIAVSESLRREERIGDIRRAGGQDLLAGQAGATGPTLRAGPIDAADALGGGYRRSARRISAAVSKRDQGS